MGSGSDSETILNIKKNIKGINYYQKSKMNYLITLSNIRIGRKIQTLFKGILELCLRLWSPPCVGYHYRGYTVQVRTITIRFTVWVRVRDRVRVTLSDWGGA